ncbi:hypothetical protein BGX29_010037 [Mortierella sp. GBA35]|nr:hypothetical protein BGX23_007678 [Mortierella sp. AD031]KAF9093219.1 hypothetical protein BGX29_010037 [Mortierella sp. GBA35]KAG0201838.1 hypothetical protein BGX33_010079 [Mortierella sp. NVP41]
MTTIKQRIAQQWPRYTVGLYAVWGLLSGLASLWLGVHLNSFTDKKFLHPLGQSELGPEEEDRLIKTTFLIMGSLMAITNAIALYASIRKSVWATKASLVFWIAQMGAVSLFVIMALIALLSMSDEDRRELPRPSAWNYVKMALDIGLTAFHGWALLVFLRDLNHRSRNVWGRLVKSGGVFEYEPVPVVGPVHL